MKGIKKKLPMRNCKDFSLLRSSVVISSVDIFIETIPQIRFLFLNFLNTCFNLTAKL